MTEDALHDGGCFESFEIAKKGQVDLNDERYFYNLRQEVLTMVLNLHYRAIMYSLHSTNHFRYHFRLLSL